jgi:hypothetical protein
MSNTFAGSDDMCFVQSQNFLGQPILFGLRSVKSGGNIKRMFDARGDKPTTIETQTNMPDTPEIMEHGHVCQRRWLFAAGQTLLWN